MSEGGSVVKREGGRQGVPPSFGYIICCWQTKYSLALRASRPHPFVPHRASYSPEAPASGFGPTFPSREPRACLQESYHKSALPLMLSFF